MADAVLATSQGSLSAPLFNGGTERDEAHPDSHGRHVPCRSWLYCGFGGVSLRAHSKGSAGLTWLKSGRRGCRALHTALSTGC